MDIQSNNTLHHTQPTTSSSSPSNTVAQGYTQDIFGHKTIDLIYQDPLTVSENWSQSITRTKSYIKPIHPTQLFEKEFSRAFEPH